VWQFLVGLVVAAGVGAVSVWLYCRAADRRMQHLRDRSRQNARLAYLGSLAGGLAHEIKNPLSTININLELLEEDLEKNQGNPTRIRTRLEGLRREVKRLQEVLDDFLRFAHGYQLHLAEEWVNGLVDEVLDFVSPETQQKKINIIKGFEQDLRSCELDRNLIKQAFLNIIINAQQAMPEGGDLMVRTAGEDEHVRVEFTDTGTGISPENLSRVWDVYFSTKKGGTGLGLPTARRIIEEHSGTIQVHSELDKGTVFTVRLPVKQPDRKGTDKERTDK